MEHLWPGSIVTENSINKQIANLRKLFNDDSKNPKYIQTVPKLGYRFICSISDISQESHLISSAAPARVSNAAYFIVGLTLLFTLLIAALVYRQYFSQSLLPQTP